MRLVVDASVTIKWFLWTDQSEPNADNALKILAKVDSAEFGMIQPPHWKAEVLAVLARQRPDKAPDAIAYLDTLERRDGRSDEPMNAVYRRACDLSNRLQHHLFDTLYHALALERGATLVTADERYFSKAASQGNIERLDAFRPI